ncbi:MAG: hypothetical protein KDB14_21175 [Planctomycetales bacterium]|nr:hypothetical protein [Planctomycetales bacterium]
MTVRAEGPTNPTRLCLLAAGLAWGVLSCGNAAAQTSYPMLMSLHPVAAQTGATTEHTLESRYSMFGATAVVVTGEGVTGEIVHPPIKEGAPEPNLQSISIKFTVAEDALPGVRDFRILTPRGVSTLGQLVVARDKVEIEAKPSSPEDPQAMSVPGVWCGVIEKAEDVDAYRFHATAGQRLSFHVRCMRLQDKIHDLQTHADPIITLRNSSGATLATSDNVFYGDPFLSHTFREEGDYQLEIRDVRYQGNKYWSYSVEVNDRPFVTNTHPLAVERGKQAQLSLVGAGLQAGETIEVALEDRDGLAPLTVAASLGDGLVYPEVMPSELPVVLESDTANETHEQAQLVTAPAMICGRIGAEADIDCFKFAAKKGERWSFEVIARRCQSALDSHLRVLDASGKQLQLNDDLRLGKRGSSDSWVENWTVPADGEYVVEVRDLHLRGGPEFVYAVRVSKATPYFELYLDTDKTLLTPGLSAVIFARIVRKNGFDGEVELAIDGLPEGVTASCGRVLSGKAQDGCIVLTAAPNAGVSLANVTVRGRGTWTEDAADGEKVEHTFETAATSYQETYQPGGGRGHYPVELHTVSVGAPGDILGVKLGQYEVNLKPGESATVEVELVRAGGFDKNVSLDVIYKHLSSVYGDTLPEGVTLDAGASKTLLTKGATKGQIVLKADPKAAPVEKQQIVVMANVSLNFVMKASYCSEPLMVTVAGEGK